MQQLRFIIGPAPSEMTPDELLAKLTLNRERTREAFERFRSKLAAPAKAKTKKVAKAKKLKAIEAAGVSLEDLQAVIDEELKKGETA